MGRGQTRPVGSDRYRQIQYWVVRIAGALALALTAAYLPDRIAGEAGSDQVSRLEEELATTRAAIAARRAANAEERRAIDALKDDAGAIEAAARRELGMVRPGELILRFETPPPATLAEATPRGPR